MRHSASRWRRYAPKGLRVYGNGLSPFPRRSASKAYSWSPPCTTYLPVPQTNSPMRSCDCLTAKRSKPSGRITPGCMHSECFLTRRWQRYLKRSAHPCFLASSEFRLCHLRARILADGKCAVMLAGPSQNASGCAGSRDVTAFHIDYRHVLAYPQSKSCLFWRAYRVVVEGER
jgi:hypothetical protein